MTADELNALPVRSTVITESNGWFIIKRGFVRPWFLVYDHPNWRTRKPTAVFTGPAAAILTAAFIA